jgi:hypothetical protein
MVRVITYAAQHLIAGFLVNKRYVRLTLLLMFLAGVALYAGKVDSYDIPNYMQAWNEYSFEGGYLALVGFVKLFTQDRVLGIHIIQGVLMAAFCILGLYYAGGRKNYLFACIAMFASVAFTLGVNNGLRQGFSSIFLLLALGCMLRGKWLPFAITLALSVLFHKSAVLFFAFSLGSYCIYCVFFRKRAFRNHATGKIISPWIAAFVLLGVAVIGLALMQALFRFGIYSGYQDRNTSVDYYRTSSFIKTLSLFATFIVSEYLLGKTVDHDTDFSFLRFLRMGLLFFVGALSFNPGYYELVARICYFYFAVEIVLVIVAWRLGKRLAPAFMLMSYALALNAINILAIG